MTFLLEMIDDAGTGKGSDFVACAGYIATTGKWQSFETEWRQFLRSYGVPPAKFSMKSYAHFKEPFEAWRGDAGKRSRFMARGLEIIRTHVEHGFVAIIKKADYQAAVDKVIGNEFGGPFAFCAQQVVSMTEVYLKTNPRGIIRNYNKLRVAYVFERGTSGLGFAIAVIEKSLRELLGWKISKNRFFDSYEKDALPLHTADILAYETCKFFNDSCSEAPRLRTTYKTLLVSGIPHWMIGLNREELTETNNIFREPMD